MRLSTRTIVAILIGVPVVVFTAALLSSLSQPRNGERTVRGRSYLEPNTIACEEFCSRIQIPEGSRRLRTNILSKKHLGVVRSDYSYDSGCMGILKRVGEQLTSLALRPRGAVTKRELFVFTRVDSGYRGDHMEVRVSCSDMPTLFSDRYFTISCSWNANQL